MGTRTSFLGEFLRKTTTASGGECFLLYGHGEVSFRFDDVAVLRVDNESHTQQQGGPCLFDNPMGIVAKDRYERFTATVEGEAEYDRCREEDIDRNNNPT